MIHYLANQEMSQEFGKSGENRENRENDESRKNFKIKDIRRW
jgi:hypothetical protein